MKRRAKRRHSSQTRTVVVDLRREPHGQNCHISGANKLQAVGDHDGVADRHVRSRLELATSKPLRKRSWSARRAVTLTDPPHEGLHVRRRFTETRRNSLLNQPVAARGSLLLQGRVVAQLATSASTLPVRPRRFAKRRCWRRDYQRAAARQSSSRLPLQQLVDNHTVRSDDSRDVGDVREWLMQKSQLSGDAASWKKTSSSRYWLIRGRIPPEFRRNLRRTSRSEWGSPSTSRLALLTNLIASTSPHRTWNLYS